MALARIGARASLTDHILNLHSLGSQAAFQEKVLRQFRAMAASDSATWRVVDASGTVDDVAAELAAATDAAGELAAVMRMTWRPSWRRRLTQRATSTSTFLSCSCPPVPF